MDLVGSSSRFLPQGPGRIHKMNKLKKVLLVGGSVVVAAKSFATDPTDAAGVVTAATAIPTTATAAYIAGAILGLGMLSVGIVIYVLRRGVKTK